MKKHKYFQAFRMLVSGKVMIVTANLGTEVTVIVR